MASFITQTETEAGVNTRSHTRKLSVNASTDMGAANGKANGPFGGARGEAEALSAVPQNVPTITDLKKALPANCFTPSIGKSFYYVAKDLAIVAGLYVAQVAMERALPAEGGLAVARYAATALYWYLQGTMFWAIFVLGHDCGHGSFSTSTPLNDAVGNLLHSFLLVPYYPWKMSHQHHHKNTGNIEKDEIFYPVRQNEYNEGGKSFLPYFGFGASWFIYLFYGYAPRKECHINPFSGLFARKAMNCLLSLVCMGTWFTFGMLPYANTFGWTALTVHYLMPVFVFASWLVVVTFLHHQDENVPWYADEKWDFVRGQLSSVDRNYGWAHDLIHNIGTHQIHHLFSKIPHYNLEEATAVFRAKYPHLVRKSDAPILKDFSKLFYIFNEQQWIKKDTQVHTYRAGKKAL